jgi:glutamate carboxypeptidase
VTDWLALAGRYRDPLFELLEQLVRIESPTSDKAGNDRAVRLAAGKLASLGGAVSVNHQSGFGDHIAVTWPGNGAHGLVIGHVDTVWPLGTLARMGYAQKSGRIFGPGVLDMKGGVAATVTALQMLKDAGLWPSRPIEILLNSDEERGSPSSRPLIEAAAMGAAYCIVMEPGQGPKGALKTRRKGLGEFKVTVRGRAAHAGVAPEKGVSAIHELAHQVLRIQSFANSLDGISVNVGLISGGSARNTVPAHAEAIVDVRAPDAVHCKRLEAGLRSLQPVLKGAKIVVEGGFHRPPMERTPAIAELIERVQGFGRELGLELPEEPTGGGSDANLTAAQGVPTVDGMGPVGENPHAEGECIVPEELVKRTALLARALYGL